LNSKAARAGAKATGSKIHPHDIPCELVYAFSKKTSFSNFWEVIF